MASRHTGFDPASSRLAASGVSGPPSSSGSSLHNSHFLPSSSTLLTCDSLVGEYLLFRGFTSSVLAFHEEKDGLIPGVDPPPSGAPDSGGGGGADAASGNSHQHTHPYGNTNAYYRSVLFSPEKLVAAIWTSLAGPVDDSRNVVGASSSSPRGRSFKDFEVLWTTLCHRFFANVVAGGSGSSSETVAGVVEDFETNLIKLYLVRCIADGLPNKVLDFFKTHSVNGTWLRQGCALQTMLSLKSLFAF